ncbi:MULTISPECIES: VOC family protein [unclassified Streptomyces]|uniref:VOC family protein n=1 Tax=unclassified Streptomyces TaxID=2593676 RepID=UPI000B1DD938|nr:MULTISPECIES: VOC family protein [unclassified Streptomyces]MCX5147832.1 VOC family protein [Streptomyces sp. NBC_00320]WSN50949.1 VOC family protein [Streptomyces sp. NBC_01296]WSW45948.1 VOC family protein [Streptomyces sp. NBC_01001]WSW59605.1 VOC family protein [Streptomyces sp. NBC_00998]
MPTMIFVNLPVKDIDAAKAFWGKLGYSFNPQFSDESTGCLVISDTIFAMLMTEARFKDFATKEVADATKSTEVMLALSADSREKVDEVVDAALAAGGTEPRPAQDLGFMYGRAFEDLEGHVWEYVWMDPAAVQG